MNFEITRLGHNLGNNKKELFLETGLLAKQADGSVLLSIGSTVILAVVVSKKEAEETADFLPLTVEYKEKYAAIGKFPGGFFKRETRPSNNEILVSRIIDRALRPMFPDNYYCDTQLQVFLISADNNELPDSYTCIAASTALLISDIPFNTPISEVRVGRIDGKYILNPTNEELKLSDIDIMVGGSNDSIVMVEGEFKEISEADMLYALKFAHEAIKKLCDFQLNFAKNIKNPKAKRELLPVLENKELEAKLREFAFEKIIESCSTKKSKKERHQTYDETINNFIKLNNLEEPNDLFLVKKYFGKIEKECARKVLLESKIRLDGRKPNEIRPINCIVDYLPSVHGSAVFTRGETQSLTTVTLGNKLDMQLIDGVSIQGEEKFMLHYNFPSFSTGEVKPIRSISRREIGHGNLAQRALKNVISSECPYTIRIVSDILESNGSSSMATVCAGSLALMDSGVQVTNSVSGIAMGLISDGKNYVVLSDILGDEDHLGDMDFKVTGTHKGITACQMDIKLDGLNFEILENALAQAREGRLHILGEMNKTLSNSRPDYKNHVPRMVSFEIPKDQVGEVIGTGGKIIQGIQKTTGTIVTIDSDESLPMARVEISGVGKEKVKEAENLIKGIIAVPEIGKNYNGTVKTITEFGAFIEYLPGKQALLHVSEIDWKRVTKVTDYFKEGDKIEVQLIGFDKEKGKYKLSRKVLLPKE